MDATVIPPALRDRLGPDATAGLLELLAQPQPTWKADVIEAVTDRFERRLVEETSKLRIEMAQGFAALRHEISDLRQELTAMRQAMTLDRFELLKWVFLFWVGQFFATASLAVFLVRFLKSGG